MRLILFLAAQYVGIAVVQNYVDVEATAATGNYTVRPLPAVAGVQLERPQLEENTSFVYIMAAVLIGTGLILVLVRFKQVKLWKLWFFLAVTICLTVAFGAFLNAIAAAVLAIVLALWKVLRPNIIVHNVTELFVYGGLAAFLAPVMNVWAALALLVLVSFYDMYAVWKSKHMVALATFQRDAGMFAGLLLPYSFGNGAMPRSGSGPGMKVQTAVLGGGDMGFPLLFAATLLKQQGLTAALTIPPFAALGLVVLLIMAKKDRFYPAMPAITIGCLVGWAVTFLF
ncbi:MAG: presenilin family intramembrane aspartyl protease [Nanoarchaeota archaeon]